MLKKKAKHVKNTKSTYDLASVHNGVVLSMLITSDDYNLFTGDDYGCLLHWDLISNQLIKKFQFENQNGIYKMDWKDY